MAKDFSHNPHLGVNRQWAGLAGIGALTLCCALTTLPAFAVSPSGTEQAAMQAQHNFDIPAQSLASALISFGQQSGLQVSVDSALLENRTSRSVSGSLSSAKALDNLLKGSGVGWTYSYGNLLLYRDEPLAGEDTAMEIGTTVVLGSTEEKSYMGETVIGEKAIKAFPGANGDITTLLRMHPSVQFSSNQQSSNTPGELEPANISINGAKYYQNNFMIDGISINNDLDPGAQSYGLNRQFDATPSNSHGIALDADLLQEVKVYDSNVPAEYGGFNGGVIDAITRRPSQELHGKISASMTRSEWTKYHLNEGDEVEFANASNEQYQPDFEKLTVRGTLEGHITDDFGAIVNFSQKRSTINLNAYDNGYQSKTSENNRDQTRRIDNYLIKTYWNVNERLTLDSSFTYAPQENTFFTANRKNSEFTNINGGYQTSFKAIWSGDKATWTHKLALTDLTSSRDADTNNMVWWYYSADKNWGNPTGNTARSVEGNVGSLEQRQRGITYTLKSDWVPLQFAGLEHNLTSGIELAHTVAEWERDDEVTAVTGFTRDNGTTCAAGDDLCSVSRLLNNNTRQFGSLKTVYGAGSISITENKYAFYLQDNLQLGKLGLRPGLRFEGDDYMEKKTIAPRFAGDYDFFGDRSTVAVFGANRYYGRNIYKYRLADGRQQLNKTYRRTSSGGNWTVSSQQLNTTRFSGLDIPYDDELMAGIEQRWFDTEFKLKYVHREGRDKIIRPSARIQGLPAESGYATTYYSYTNDGQSESDNVSLTITPLKDLEWQGTKTSLQWALDWSKIKSADANYDEGLTINQFENLDVIYDGQIMKYDELPASDYNRPWTARMTAITEIPQWNLTISNFIRYRGPYDQIVETNDEVFVGGTALPVFEAVRVSAAPTWDMRLDWEIPTGKDEALFVGVDVTNVTDKVNSIAGRTNTSATTYETGRQFWLEVGYRF